MNDSVSDKNLTVTNGRSGTKKEDMELRIALAVLYCLLGSSIVITSVLLIYKLKKQEKCEKRRWDSMNRVVAKVLAGVFLFPVCAILVINETNAFLSVPSCYVLLGLQLFAFIGHHLCGYLSISLVRLSIVYPLRSNNMVTSRCMVLSISALWGANALFVTISTLVFVLQPVPKTSHILVASCSWMSMYPKVYLYITIYTILIVGGYLALLTVARLRPVVKHHRTQIDAQNRVSGHIVSTTKTSWLKSPKCKLILRISPGMILMMSASVLLLLHIHCVDCIGKPWGMFAIWYQLGLGVLWTIWLMYSKKYDLT